LNNKVDNTGNISNLLTFLFSFQLGAWPSEEILAFYVRENSDTLFNGQEEEEPLRILELGAG
jgi:hypothetical protein